ncbi:MAG: hypothetical protein H8E86_04565 [Planctomycetes bacterium]|nr:hypothetical protein [Planctomycetota bacterium]
MNRKDDTIAILFVSALTIIIWIWAAGKTKYTSDVLVTLYLSPAIGSTSTISPESTSITLTLSGARAAVDAAKSACEDGLHLTLSEADEKLTLSEVSTRIAALDAIKDTGAKIDDVTSRAFPLAIHTVELVEAAVEVSLPNITVSGDVTVDPAIVTLHIPKELRKTLPEAITVEAVISELAIQQLQPGIVHKRDAIIRVSKELEQAGVTASPSRVEVSFKIQSSTITKELAQVRVLIAGPAEDYAAYSITLPRKVIPNVTVAADTEIIAGIESGTVKVFAMLRLASSDLAQRIATKRVTAFLAILEDGTGHEVVASVQDPALLDIELNIEPISHQSTP